MFTWIHPVEMFEPPNASTARVVTYFNPVVYLINGLRFSFYGVSDFNIWISVGLMLSFLIICIVVVTSLLKKGYNIKA